MKKKVLSVLIAAAMVLTMGGCGLVKTSDDAPDKGGTSTKKEEDGGTIKVGYTVQSMENAYFVSIVEGMKAAAKEKGIDLVVADAAADASKHISQIEDFVSQGVDAIIISPVDQEAPADAVKKAQDAGIPVISLDQEVKGSDAFFGIDEEEYGRLGGELAGKWLNEKESDGTIDEIVNDADEIEVVVVRYDQIPSVIKRAEGLKKGLEDTYTGDKKINYVYEQNAADADTGYNLSETALTTNPKVSMFICINDSSALGVYESCLTHKEHTPDNTCIIGLDALPEALKLVSQDTMYKGTVDIKPAEKGADVLDLVKDVLENGPKSEMIVYDMSQVTKDNIGDYDIE
ncbi:substrate-binding domain-containing protein [Faecalicatena orotica]|uniref:Monosaccharide ABC transporter substrate-binding protein (CUT2 family) n=1 Tax=Faecalicatena orotica TaxID=1544 RepID=A0A2Y9BD61_9FIRM|nr:sugar ABC transporter substrate-binding protein [Faecalicatena orotica]PWJ29379.1 monosaccharide ABC transporter substrate-binding protein (CUT2 family) [Faecalicatena orotica]SSA55834.1 monosaccharide ABC transporter substrate-binding protein, CUT2 family [Faecalicatena orotica]